MTSTTDQQRRPPLHLGCGMRHSPFTPCPEAEAAGDDQEVTDTDR